MIISAAAHSLAFGESMPSPYRFGVQQYMKMLEAGVFATEPRIELIDGLVVEQMKRLPPHDGTLSILTRRLCRLLPDSWIVRCRSCLVFQHSVPEPDLAVVRGPDTPYMRRHPEAGEASLVIEVSEASLEFDRTIKGPIYAGGRIPEYWIVNVIDLQIEVHTEPRGGKVPGYRSHHNFCGRKRVPVILDGCELTNLSISDLFAGLTASEGK